MSSEARAAILCALLGGTAHTHTELSRHLGRPLSTVSEHVSVLLDAGLVVVEAQGRHRYVRLADRRVAEMLERLGSFDDRATSTFATPLPRVPADLAFARSCYGHLAGELGVRLFDGMLTAGWVEQVCGGPQLTGLGSQALDDLGIRPSPGRAALVRSCLDWSQRRHHLAGRYGDAILAFLLTEGWLRRDPRHPRVVVLTARGRSDLHAHLPVAGDPATVRQRSCPPSSLSLPQS